MWVHGCRLYFLRWTVVVGAVGADSFFEVDVEVAPIPSTTGATTSIVRVRAWKNKETNLQ